MIPCVSLFLFRPMSCSMRCTHLLFGKAWGSLAEVLISVHVSGPDFCNVSRILSRKSSYVSIEVAFLGRFQYGLLHFGQTDGSCSPFLGIHSWLHRSQR